MHVPAVVGTYDNARTQEVGHFIKSVSKLRIHSSWPGTTSLNADAETYHLLKGCCCNTLSAFNRLSLVKQGQGAECLPIISNEIADAAPSVPTAKPAVRLFLLHLEGASSRVRASESLLNASFISMLVRSIESTLALRLSRLEKVVAGLKSRVSNCGDLKIAWARKGEGPKFGHLARGFKITAN